MIEQPVREARHAFRSLVRAPILSSVIVLSLAVGIGANTVVFSWLQALVLRPLPGVPDASEFHVIEPVTDTETRPGSSWPEYIDLLERVRSIDDLLAFRMVPLNVGEAARTERTYALLVSGSYFRGLRLEPAVGRFIRDQEVSRPGAEPVVVISFDYWQNRFNGSPDAIGRTLRANDRELTIRPYGSRRRRGALPRVRARPARQAPGAPGGGGRRHRGLGPARHSWDAGPNL